MCGVSQRELDALNIALERGKDLWIWGDKNQPIGLIKVEKIFWRYDKSEDLLFHLYRIPRGEQLNIKIKRAHKKTLE